MKEDLYTPYGGDMTEMAAPDIAKLKAIVETHT